jgi:hypothetical protein
VPLATYIAHAAEQDHVHRARRDDDVVGRLDRFILNQAFPRRPTRIYGHQVPMLREKAHESLRTPTGSYFGIYFLSSSLGGFLLPFLRLSVRGLSRGYARATDERAARRPVQMTKRALAVSAMSDRKTRAISASLG